jgi:uncharacterized protein (DUF4415 family)
MNNNSDPLYERLKEVDFSDAKRAHEVPHLARLQAQARAGGVKINGDVVLHAEAGKSRITIRVDNRTLAAFKARADATGGNYQTLMNEALAQFAQGQTLADVVRETIRETMAVQTFSA